MVKLITQYQAMVDAGDIENDVFQRDMLPYLQNILDSYAENQCWWRHFFKLKKAVKGLYFYGGVGVGKTFLMDLFCQAFPSKRKMRKHFHEFMKDIHDALQTFEGKSNPLMRVAASIARDVDLLCLDECVVNDIGDAMIIERLFTTLFASGVILVTTSNFRPDDLYLEGLHRQRFLGAIDLIKESCQIVPILSQQDHRRALFERAGTYLSPLGPKSENTLAQFFQSFSDKHTILSAHFQLEGRDIESKARSEMAIWFDFDKICASPRSQRDYLNLANHYSIVIISQVPVIPEKDLSMVTYFMLLVDVLYDKGRALILSAESQAESLYPKGQKVFEFQRTLSRLEEMGSKPYLEAALKK